MSFLANAASVLATSLATTLIGVGSSIVLARYLSTDDRGFYGLSMTILGLSVLLFQLGWAPASIYRLRRLRSPADRVATAALGMVVTMGVLVCAAGLLARPWIQARFFEGAPSQVVLLIIVAFPMLLAANVFSGVARGIDHFVYQNSHQLVLQGGTLAGLVLALVVWEGAIVAALTAHVSALGVATAGLVGLVLWQTGLERRIDRPELVESAKFGLQSHLQSLAGQVHERADILMIGLLLDDPSQVAFYSIAVGVAALTKMIPESLSVALLPTLAGIPEEDAGPFVARITRSSLAATFLALAGLGAVAPLLVPAIYGSPYAASVEPLLILLPGIGFLSAYRLLARYFIALGRQRVNIVTQTISATVNIALNLVLIPRYGIGGAAAASFASYSLEAVMISLAFRRRSGIGWRETFVPRRSDVSELRALLQRGLRARRG